MEDRIQWKEMKPAHVGVGKNLKIAVKIQIQALVIQKGCINIFCLL